MFSIFCKSPELLLDRLCGLVNFKCVLSQLPGTLGMSNGLHAKVSALSLWKLVSANSYLGSRLAPMTTFLDASGMLRKTFFTAGLGSKDVLVHFCSGTSRVVWSILAA
jgi:hypothetical protein